MRQNKGYIRLHRNIVDWCWYKNANTFRVFIHLLLNANTRPYRFENIIINRGEIATSYDRIAGALNLSYKQVRTAVEHIVRAGTGAVKQYPKFLVITILNYNAYQSDGQSDGQPEGSQISQKIQNFCENGQANGQANGQGNNQPTSGETANSGQANGQTNGQAKGNQRAGKGQQLKNNKNNKNKKEYIALSGEPEFDVDRYNF
jgi:hypothetical protein